MTAGKVGRSAASFDPTPLAEPKQVCVPTAAELAAGPPIAPRKRIWLYDPDDWENFVLEWANVLEEPYVDIVQLGGPNDRGIDVAGFLSSSGLEGDWHCFQCKHYRDVISPSVVWPEITKIFTASIVGHCRLPSMYLFLSPKGCGPTLKSLLNSPTRLRERFLAELRRPDSFASEIDLPFRSELEAYATAVDFSIFGEANIENVLEVHKRSPHHARRFGVPLPGRPDRAVPPQEPAPKEHRYVQQLMEVYNEKHPGTDFTPAVAETYAATRRHFPRQRVNFYCAESLRLFARDSVPEGTFERLQSDVLEGVIEIEEKDHSDGMERLNQVLQASMQVDLSSNSLISASDPRDRKGICHQLANDDRLTWVRRGC